MLEHLLGTLRYLQYGLAAVLAFAGVKLIAAEWIHMPPLLSVGIIAACIGCGRAGQPARPPQRPTARNKYITHPMPGDAQTPNLMGVPR